MINVIGSLINGFFASHKCYVWALLISLVIFISAYLLGVKDGKNFMERKYSALQVAQSTDALNQFITGTKQLMQAANEASNALSRQLNQRKLYDENSTKALQVALKKTSDGRRDCLFDNSVLQFIDAARARAVSAATHGVTSNASSAMQNSSAAQK